jgi:hypothetical protein
MSSNSFIEPTVKDRFFSIFFTILLILVLITSSFYITVNYGIFYFLLICILGIFLLVKWHSSTRGFKCANCGHEFTISFWQDLPTASSIPFMKKMLKCPSCDYKDYASEVVLKKSG